jgi:hypothetical protein
MGVSARVGRPFGRPFGGPSRGAVRLDGESPEVVMIPSPARRLAAASRPALGPPDRGIALVAVVTVLVALLIIAIPLAISMKLGRDRTETSAARNQAQFEAGLVADAVASWLRNTHPYYERQRGKGGTGGADADDRVDGLDEVQPPASYRDVISQMSQGGAGAAPRTVDDPRGSIWSWRVTDANALVNPLGASPYLLGGLLGSATLADDLDASATTIHVTNVAPIAASGLTAFRPTGGYLRIGAETIKYAKFDPANGFTGCVRGDLAGSAPLEDNGKPAEHKKGAIVVDYVAYKLATHLISANPGRLTPFRNVEDLRSIQAWGGDGVLPADRFEALAPFVTVWSRRETAETFLDGQLVINPLPEAERDGGELLRFRDATHVGGSGAYFNKGTIVRITDGENVDYGVIATAGDDSGKQVGSMATMAGRLREGRRYEGGRATVQPLAPFPIDVNTAPREVLAAVFCNLSLRGVDEAKLMVGPEVAWSLAARVIESRAGPLVVKGDDGRRQSGPFRHSRDFDQFLDDLQKKDLLSPQQRSALIRNAVNPHDDQLAFGTAPFCYRTQDVYVVETRAIVNDAGGQKVAESALRQVIEIGPDAATVWEVSTQADFEVALALGSGGKYFETYPVNVAYVSEREAYVQPRKRAPAMIQYGHYASDDASADVGDVRHQGSRVKLTGKPALEDHMDASEYTDGWYTPESGAYTKAVKGLLKTDDLADPYLHPFTTSFWLRPYTDSPFYAFDTGREADQNRVSLFVREGESGNELVLRVCDSTLDKLGAEVYVPLSRIGYEPETWWHLQASVRGCDPTLMELLVDGIACGKRRGVSFLTSGLSKDATSIPLEDTQGFETQGAVLVGDEVVEYDNSGPDGLLDCVRGRRGTRARDWPQGVAVKRLGYSHPILLDVRKGGSSLPQEEWEIWKYMKVVYEEDEITFPGTNVIAKGMAEDEQTAEWTLTKADPQDAMSDEQMAKSFNQSGYAIVSSPVYHPPTGTGTGGAVLASAPADDPPMGPGGAIPPGLRPPPPSGGSGTPSTPGTGGSPTAPPTSGPTSGGGNVQIGGWEVVWYERTGPTRFRITRYQNTILHADAGTPYFLPTTAEGNEDRVRAYMCPVSFVGTASTSGGSNDDYFNPAIPSDKESLDRYPEYGDPDDTGPDVYNAPRVIVGSDSPQDSVECLRYDSIDRAKASPLLLFVRDEEAALVRLKDRLIPWTIGANPNQPTGGDPGTPGTPAPPTGPSVPPGFTPPGTGPLGPGGSIPPGLRPPGGGATLVSLGAGDGGLGGPGVASPDPDPQPDPQPDPPGAIPPGLRPPADPPTDSGSPGSPGEPGGEPTDPTDPTTGESAITASGPFDPVSMDVLKGTFPFRGVSDTKDRHHASLAADDFNSRLLPCFRVLTHDKETGMRTGGYAPGFNDLMTLVEEGPVPRRELRRVRWSHEAEPSSPAYPRARNWVALSEFLEGAPFKASELADDVRADYRGRTRALKFPSGEMPDETGDDVTWCQDSVGGGGAVTAFLDEVYLWRHDNTTPLGLVVNGDNLTEKSEEITLRAVPPATSLVGIEGHDVDCAVVDLDGELIVYRGTRNDSPDTITLEDCARGCFGTKARAHATLTYARFVPETYVSFLTGGLSPTSSVIAVGRTRGWPREGCVRIVGDDALELVHFTSRSETDLQVPESLSSKESDRGRGLLRGRYGTEPASHESNEIVYWQPFRFWDRYTGRRGEDRTRFAGVHEHPDSSHLELAKTVYGGFWRRVTWDENVLGRGGNTEGKSRKESQGHAASKMDVLVLARFDQGVPWDSENVVDLRGDKAMTQAMRDRAKEHLFLFDDPESANALDLEADTAEFRVFFPYLQGAYVAQDLPGASSDDLVFENTWKQTPWLKAFYVEYVSRTKSRYKAFVR